MKETLIKYGIFAIALLAVFLITKHFTDEYWRDKIKNTPVVWAKPDTGKPILIPQPTQVLTGPVKRKPASARIAVNKVSTDSLQVIVEQLSMENEWLKLDVSTSLSDTLGGQHDILYSPDQGLITEKYSPPPRQILPITQMGTKTVLDERKDLIWLELRVGYFERPTYGAMIFVDRFGVGATRIGNSWLYEAGVKIPIL